MVLVVKNPPANAGNIRDSSSIPGWGRSPGGRHSNPLQYSCLEKPMDRGAWRATVHSVDWSDLAHTYSRGLNYLTQCPNVREENVLYFSLRNIIWFIIQSFVTFYLMGSCCSITKSCSTPCDPMDGSTPGLPILHHLPKLAQVHIHWVSDAIQPSHPLSFPSPALNLSSTSGTSPVSWLLASSGQNIGASISASILPVNIQGWFPSEG